MLKKFIFLFSVLFFVVCLDCWEKRKKAFLARLSRDRCTGYFDEEMYSLVSIINSHPLMYTTSCCSGRISMLEVKNPWTKLNARVIGKWHKKIEKEEVLEKISLYEGKKEPNLWIIVQPPIIHVSCKNLETASKLVVYARNSGFKESGIFFANSKRVMVEIRSSEKTSIPLVLNGKKMLNEQNFNELIEYLNSLLENLKLKIERLEKNFSNLQN